MILVNEMKGQVFFLAEKCASTSIREALLATRKWKHVQSTKPCDADAALTEKYGMSSVSDTPLWKLWQTYAVVRSPYARAVSYWAYRKKLKQTTKDFGDFLFSTEFSTFDSLDAWYGKNEIDGVYLQALDDVLPWMSERYTKIAPFEQQFGVVLPRVNESEHAIWQTYYDTQDKIDFVNKWAANDFERFRLGRLYKTTKRGV